jgi:hypothetical protein
MCYEQFLEDQDYELNARYDYVREAYGDTAKDLADDVDPDDGYMTDPDAVRAFILGGRAVFTLVSKKTHTRYTFRVSRAKDNENMFFVGTLTGPDNGSDYAYLGFFQTMHGGRVLTCRDGAYMRAGKKGNPDDVRFRGLDYLLRAIARGELPADVEFWHEGRCARCARVLTDPVSIARGFGPECAGKA